MYFHNIVGAKQKIKKLHVYFHGKANMAKYPQKKNGKKKGNQYHPF